MKTLHLSIISAIGIGLGIASLMIFGNISPALPPSHDWNSGTLIDTPGLGNSYQVGATAKFSILIHGFTNHRCATPAIVLYKDDQPDKPILNYSSFLMSCPINDTSSYTLYLPSKSDNFSATFERPGPYTLDILFDKGKSIQTHFLVTRFDKTNDLSVNDCGKFYTVPENKTYLNAVPVLLMKSNSTACARLTFMISSNYNDCNGPNCQHIFSLGPMLFIRNLHYEKNGGSFSITTGKDYTNSFKIMTAPDTVDLASYPLGANFTATYVLSPLPNATGFYDQSIPRLYCERYPLVVGYSKDQVNASDFSYIDPLNPPCVSGAYVLTKVEVSGMDYKEVTLRLAVLEQGR